MTTEKDLNTLNLSPTNKDYYQVWSELIETAGKLSERWDPSSTNESDPGIVLLKVLTAIADKLNYNIDKNILEAFMPTAAQAESMKRLCDMLGYHVGYYESATTDITIRYIGNTQSNVDNPERLPDGTDDRGTGLFIPAFTVLHNDDKSIYYSTTKGATLTNDETFLTIPCIEGQRVLCETGTGSLVTLNNLDFNNRYYLPEIQIAENGIFVYGTAGGSHTNLWKKVNNLNIIPNDTKAYSFGFDSKENRPYLQFPDDIGHLIEDGLEIYYIRTSGAAGNVSARTITAFEKPTDGAWKDYTDVEKFVITNPKAALNGKNPETIEQAYNGFKKTIGTFDTLVTCRDYMNKIYQLVDEHNNELVSNVIVSDIRDDINRAHVLCSFSDYGIVYVEKANYEKSNTVINSTLDKQEIDHFDLMVYPFKAYQRVNDKRDYVNSFTYSDAQMPLISAQLADIKSIAHSIINPVGPEITCIKNYLQLNARISTVNKVNAAEEKLIIENVKKALFKSFNMHELDFGEAIPYEAILKCMEQADPKIKSIALDEPKLYTKFATVNGIEYDLAAVGGDKTGTDLYNKLALRNILAGRVELFRYDAAFKVELGEALYPTNDYSPIYPETTDIITRIVTECKKDLTPQYSGANSVVLKPNEVVKFRAPSLKTLTPYSSYVNYHLILNQKESEPAEAARFIQFHKLWKMPLDSRLVGLTLDSDNLSYVGNGIFTDNTNQSLFFSTDFIKFIWEGEYKSTFIENLTDFVSIGKVKSAGMIDTREITWPNGYTPLSGKDPAKASDLEAIKADLVKKTPTEGDTSAYTACANKLDELRKLAEDQLVAYQDAANYCNLYLLTKDGDGKDTIQLIYDKALSEDTLCNYAKASGEAVFYVISLKNTSTVLGLIQAWAKEFGKDFDGTEFNGDRTKTEYKLIDGATSAFRNIGINAERLPGKYVDITRAKYMPATQPDISQNNAWAAYYWPAPRCKQPGSQKIMELSPSLGWQQREKANAGEFDAGYAKTSLGTDMKLAGISPLEEYQLKSNEYLFINYTPSSSSAANDQATTAAVEPLNICHGPGTIIKPNATLTLYDSNTWHSLGAHNWAKTTGFDFSAFGAAAQDIEGMYSIGPNEQIDIRDFIEVTLSEPSYMYWILNDSHTLSSKADTEHSYTLQDGEYIFYTDKNKLDMAYYGAGTEIRMEGSGIRQLAFKHDITQINIEEIMLHGVSAVPWKMVSLDTNNYIVLREFQYITLTDGDAFRGLVLQGDKSYLDNNWTMVDQDSPCYYAFSGESMKNGGTPLPKFNFAFYTDDDDVPEGTPMRGTGLGWEARSFLELDTGPDKAQILNEGNAIYLYSGETGSNSLLTQEVIESGTPTIKPAPIEPKYEDGKIVPLAIKANMNLQLGGGDINLYASDVDLKNVNTTFAFKLKVFEDAPIATVAAKAGTISEVREADGAVNEYITTFTDELVSEDLSLYNFNTLWTSLSAEDFIGDSLSGTTNPDKDSYAWIRMHANVPENHYNLMMLYYQAPTTAYTYGQSMGFRFYTYRDKPTITLTSGDNATIDYISYNGYGFDLNKQSLISNIYLDTVNPEVAGTKQGMVIIDSENVIFKYSDANTGENHKDSYYYTLDHESSTISLFMDKAKTIPVSAAVSDGGRGTANLAASITLADFTASEDNVASEKLQSAVCRGINFSNFRTDPYKIDILGIYDAKIGTAGTDYKVDILHDRINIYTKTIYNIASVIPQDYSLVDHKLFAVKHDDSDDSILYYKLEKCFYYDYTATVSSKIIDLYADEAHTTKITNPLEGCLNFTTEGNLSLIYNNQPYILVTDIACSLNVRYIGEKLRGNPSACNGDAEFLGEYIVGNFGRRFKFESTSKNIKFTIYDSASNIEQVENLSFTITTNPVTKENTMTLSSGRFLHDSQGEHVKIFNNLSLEDLDDFLSNRWDVIPTFDDYFKKLSWWKKSELGYALEESEPEDTIAFDIKEVASYADLKLLYETEEDDGNSTSNQGTSTLSKNYRKLSGVYFLKPGLNIITFKESGKFEFFTEIDAGGALFISDIDSVNKLEADLGLNLKMLNYQYSDSVSDIPNRATNKIAYKLLRDIREKDPKNEFYYNCPLQAATAIDINTGLLGDNAEHLSDARIWYEPNNINNKFVISQIDADYLDEGIVVTKASKLR